LGTLETPLSKPLVGAAQEIGKDKPEDDRLVLRFTGGWVSDKLLSVQGVDQGSEWSAEDWTGLASPVESQV